MVVVSLAFRRHPDPMPPPFRPNDPRVSTTAFCWLIALLSIILLQLSIPPALGQAVPTSQPELPAAPLSRTHRLPIATSPGESPQSAVLTPAAIPEKNWESGHRGVDLRAQPGDSVFASRGGTVHFAGLVAGTPVISVLHADGLRTTYEPVRTELKKGETVRRGQVIGHLVDSATLGEHARKKPGLSWGARVGDTYVDPLTLLGTPHVRLYPPVPAN